jgi:hypothetical protein
MKGDLIALIMRNVLAGGTASFDLGLANPCALD